MKTKKDLFEIVNKLDLEQNLSFSKHNLRRIIHLYKDFEKMIEREKLERLATSFNYNSLVGILDRLEVLTSSELAQSIEICDLLLPYFDDYGGVETSLAISVISSLGSALEYRLIKSKDLIKSIIEEVLDINQFIELEKYQKSHLVRDLNEYLNEMNENEILKQYELFRLVENRLYE